jgi:hypothetical protein
VAAETILYQERESHIDAADVDGDELWVTLPELTAASGWELKPEGVCLEEICVPVADARLPALIRKETSGTLFNLTEFARLIEQPVAHDKKNAVWYFGPASWEWKTRLISTEAPDFSLPDLNGRMHSLSELRGRKVFLLFWASW